MNTRLIAYRGKLTESGCKVNLPGSSYAATPNQITIVVDTADATTLFKEGQRLVSSRGDLYGVIKTVGGATSITLTSLEKTLWDNSNLFYYPEQEFEMDLDEAPSIVVNYNWIDIRDPEKRMGSFSQTIKIPFTDRNNKFFENWFDVNLDTLVFDANTKFTATVFVDTVEQMKGFIQLKAIYLNARQYEIVVFGNSSNFFTAIKDKKLRQAFENVNDAGVITADEQLDHNLTASNVYNSWNAGLTTISPVTTSNDVMYPIIDYGLTPKPLSEGMFVDIFGSGWAWAMSEWTGSSSEWGLTYPNNLKPAIRIQRLLQIIAQKAGYTISSTFLGIAQDGTLSDTQWFSRLFMTLANQHERVKTYYSGLGFQVSMASALTNQTIYGDQNEETGTSVDDENYIWPMSCIRELGFTDESDPNFDPMNTFSVDPETYTAEDGDDWTIQMNTISIPSVGVAGSLGLVDTYLSEVINLTIEFNISFPQFGGSHVQWRDGGAGVYRDFDYGGGTAQMMIYIEYKVDAPGSGDDVGWTTFDSSFFIYMYQRAEVDNYANDWGDGGLQNIPINRSGTISGVTNAGGQVSFRLRFSPGIMGGGMEMTSFDYFKVNINSGMIRTNNIASAGYTNGSYGMQVVMAENMPDIRQSDFVRDLMNRFNLIILNDAENTDNLIIEPYQDYIGGGTTQYWTDKLDISKEQVIKPTSELQKQEFIFQDKEGGDVLNKHYKEQNELVYGYKRELGGEFASGDGKNFSVFAPFIAQGIAQNGDEPWDFYGQSSQGVAIAQMYEVTDEEALGKSSITDGVPRLFYYSGTPVGINGNDGVTGDPRHFRIYAPIGGSTSTATGSNPQGTFPLCTQYNLDDLDTGITSATKQLLWDWVSPSFSYPWWMNNPFGNSATIKGYYYLYWSQYFNEIYNKEARIMECYLNLTPTDISKFEAEAFKNPIYIKNTLWRVLKIDKYLVGGNQSTKVTLLKVIEKLNWDCDGVPDSFNADGTITFINPASGADTTITNLCCEQMNDSWTFQQTDSDTGVGTCYHNLNIPIVDLGYTGTDFEGLDFGSMMIPMPADNFVNNQLQRKQRRVFAQASDLLFSTVTIGTTVAYLGYRGMPQGFSMKQKTMAYVEVDLIGTVVKGTFAHIGAVGYFKYYTLLKRKNKVPTHEGSSGGTQVQKIEGTNFPTTPTINLTNINALTGSIQIAITSSSADHTISWVAKVRILSQKLVGLDGENVYRDFALYQNYSNILFENTDFLEWN